MKNYIGIVDSGVGGLTVAREIIAHFPQKNIIYFGDTAHLPYGNKSPLIITDFVDKIVKFLADSGAKTIIIACNTASAFSLDYLKKKYHFLKIIGVIDAGVRKALEVTENKKIGVIGTEGTIKSGIYRKEIKKISPDTQVYNRACPLFVPLVEEGWLEDEITYLVACRYLDFFKKKNIDSLILGCTHYPMLKKIIAKVLGEKVFLVDSGQELVKDLEEILKNEENYPDPQRIFLVSDNPKKFQKVAKIFLGYPLSEVKLKCLK